MPGFLCAFVLLVSCINPLRATNQLAGPENLPLQATASRTLLNGLRVQILATPQFPRVALHLLIGAGTTLDPAGKAGMAELAAGLLLESVSEWRGDPADIGRIIEAGKTFRYEVDWDSTHIVAECAPQEVEAYLQAMSRFVRNPVMAEKHFTAVRDRTLSRMFSLPASSALIAGNVFDAELFRGNPYARWISGTPESIRNISYGETVLFQRRYHLPNVSVLAVVGNVPSDQVKTLAGRHLGIWIMDDQFPFNFLPAPGQTGHSLIALDWAAADGQALMIGQMGVPRDSKDSDTLQLLSYLLSRRIQARLQRLAAEKRPAGSEGSLSTAVSLDKRRLKGALRFLFSGKELKVDVLVREMNQTMAILRDTGPTSEETGQAIQLLLAGLKSRAQTAAGLARMLVESETYQLGFNYYERLKQELPLLTADDLKRAAARLLEPDNTLAVYAGPAAGQNLEALKGEGWQLRVVPIK